MASQDYALGTCYSTSMQPSDLCRHGAGAIVPLSSNVCVCCLLQELCLAVQQRWQVTHVAMAHRTGTVKVCEASVIIAVSSPHRQAALEVRPQDLGFWHL